MSLQSSWQLGVVKCPPRQCEQHISHLLCISLASALRHHIGMAVVGQKNDNSGHTGSQSQQTPVSVPAHVADLYTIRWEMSCKVAPDHLPVIKHARAIQ